MEKKPAITSTAEFSKTILSAQTPQIASTVFTENDFLHALKKVSRKQPEPPAEPGDDKPKE